MVERRIETSATPHVTVEVCRGRLTVRGDSERELRLLVHATEDEVGLEREGESFTLVIPADGTLICPPDTSLTVNRVLGNLRAECLDGTLALGTVHGNIGLHEVGPVALEEGMGNLVAHGVTGGLSAKDVKGNVRLQDVEGALTLKMVAGNLVGDDLRGGLDAEMVRGNVRLGPALGSGVTYDVRADGNLTVHLLPDADLRLALRARGRVQSVVPGLALETIDGESTATLGAGETAVTAEVGGNVTLRSAESGHPPDADSVLEDLGTRIEWQVDEAIAELAKRLERTLALAEAEPIRQRVEEASERARRTAEQAAERARLRAERAERRWRRASGEAPRGQPKPASDEERLRVLRMVEDGRLTPEQGAELLAALEGS